MKQEVTNGMLQEAYSVLTEATTLYHRYFLDIPKKDVMGTMRQLKNKFKGEVGWGRENTSDMADNDHGKQYIVLDVYPKSKKAVDKYLSVHNIEVIETEQITSKETDSAFDYEGEVIGGK